MLASARHAFFSDIEIDPEDPLSQIRSRIFYALAITGLAFGTVSLVTTVTMTWRAGDRALPVLFVLVYGWMVLLVAVRRFSMRFRIINGLAVLYAIGLLVLWSALPYNIASIWFFTFSVLSALMLGIREGLMAVALNTVTLLLYGLLSPTLPPTTLGVFSNLTYWYAATFTLSMLMLIVTLCLSLFLRGLERSLDRRLQLTKQLEKEVYERTRAEQALQTANDALERRNHQLAKILTTSNQLRVDRELDLVLQQIADNRHLLGFESVAINLIDEQTGNFVVRLLAGSSPEAKALLEDAVFPWTALEQVMQDRFCIGQCYFVPAGAFDWLNGFAGPTFFGEEKAVPSGVDDSSWWHSADMLFVPLKMLSGKIIGLLSFDDPIDGMRPPPDLLQNLEIFANQAAAAIENAYLYRELQTRLADQDVTGRILRDLNAELEQAVRMKDQFLANMSHELRTPLTAILGTTEALAEGIYGAVQPRQARALNRIDHSGQHLLDLINDVLDVAKIGAGQMQLDLQPTKLDTVCRAAMELVQQAAEKKGLTVGYDNPLPQLVLSIDERRIRQVLTNLLSNAVKFTPSGGSVGVRVVRSQTNDSIRVTVWDTGIGIAEEDLSRLFVPFLQLDSSLSRSYEGTGLGLALVHRLVDLHGGSVTVESKVQEGSSFTIALPWNPHLGLETESSDEGAESEPRLDRVEPRATVLLAEDNRINSLTVADFLRKRGFRLVVVTNGLEAVHSVEHTHPDLILMDIQMPVMSGLEAMELIRRSETTSHIPIVALTALAMPGDRERCLAAGADVYMSKPVSLAALERTINEELARSASVQSGHLGE